ncbi:MAG: WD40-like beta Propeller containing protein [Gemmatimonadetes bacterium]|nr:WD40-like beta Propeller containing protein [Gemmatimonadota bacterium]
MHPTVRTALLLIICATPSIAQTTGTPRAFQLADWYKVTTLSAPAMSPSGDRVAFTVTTVREAENKRHNEIWIVPTAGGES